MKPGDIFEFDKEQYVAYEADDCSQCVFSQFSRQCIQSPSCSPVMNNGISLIFKKKEKDITLELRRIHSALKDAEKYGLQAEIIYFALLEMKKNPKLLPEEALYYAYNEWVK